jgi:hypothetical protein
MLLTVFVAAPGVDPSPRVLHSKLEALKLTPVSKRDILNVFLNPFIERHKSLLNYALAYSGLESRECQDFLKELVAKCLEIPSKVSLLRFYVRSVPHLLSWVLRSYLTLRTGKIAAGDISREPLA